MTDFLKDCKIVIINLKERQDKKKYILDLFKNKKLQYTFFEATKHKYPKKGCLE